MVVRSTEYDAGGKKYKSGVGSTYVALFAAHFSSRRPNLSFCCHRPYLDDVFLLPRLSMITPFPTQQLQLRCTILGIYSVGGGEGYVHF